MTSRPTVPQDEEYDVKKRHCVPIGRRTKNKLPFSLFSFVADVVPTHSVPLTNYISSSLFSTKLHEVQPWQDPTTVIIPLPCLNRTTHQIRKSREEAHKRKRHNTHSHSLKEGLQTSTATRETKKSCSGHY
ncbi:hypothetical protein TNIN_105831 [Trichonephila inaurata madagascariensis]|uniref:Uncharacterized protein n=1 Tax=Trichonephila inaurata madagascariensis TaxID=2747483 RepID=A0A8X6XZ70_9ARAC|nr:hypothetical protein TNIN_105831 [Trichonephila inaurata madagascariensis]